MSSPKEKAIELVDKLFNSEHCQKNHFPNNNFCECAEMNRYQAIQCAIIAVEEILNLGLLSFKDTDNEFLKPTTIPYWQQVKEELIKLKQ